MAIYQWDEDLNDWLKLGGIVDPVRQTVSVPTYHFSTYALMADTREAPQRLAGQNRFATANAVAEQGWPAGSTNVVLVNAYSFPDALAGTPLAFKLNAPILLTDSQTLTPSTWKEIEKLQAKNVTILGGEGVVSAEIEAYLKERNLNVVRYGGKDRYETAALIAQELGTTGQAVLASGEDDHFADALAMSSWAAYNGAPILFSAGNSLPDSTEKALQTLTPSSLVIAGGEGAVPQTVLESAQASLPAGTLTRRYAGMDRYGTATAIASATDLGMNLNQVYIATGQDFADALVAGNLAARTSSPLVLVGSSLPEATQGFFQSFGRSGRIQAVTNVGGEGVITPALDQAIRAQW